MINPKVNTMTSNDKRDISQDLIIRYLGRKERSSNDNTFTRLIHTIVALHKDMEGERVTQIIIYCSQKSVFNALNLNQVRNLPKQTKITARFAQQRRIKYNDERKHIARACIYTNFMCLNLPLIA